MIGLYFKLALLLGFVGLLGYSYYWTYNQGRVNAVANLNEAAVKAIKKKQEEETKRADTAIKRANQVTNQLNTLKGTLDNEKPLITGCTATGDVLHTLKTIAGAGDKP